ncbi:MAG: hypothetical protein NTU41_09500, partial [Chloroflexi bacterium]|nr:hypothetical protein [Chloroflexota bacterium]
MQQPGHLSLRRSTEGAGILTCAARDTEKVRRQEFNLTVFIGAVTQISRLIDHCSTPQFQ